MIYRFGDCVLDTDSETLRRSDEVVSVEPRAFKVLCYLFEHRNRVVTRDELFEACWPESFVSDATLTSCLRRVRQAIGQTRNGPTLIETLHRRGYRFVAEVTELDKTTQTVDSRAWTPPRSTPGDTVLSSTSIDAAAPSIPYLRPFAVAPSTPVSSDSASEVATRSKILIVDDELFNVDLLEQKLEGLGYETRCAANGQEALSQIAIEAPDLILLDVMMPVMDGFTVCRILKGDEATRLIPIVMMTALDAAEDRIQGIEAGADDFLTKPINQRELLARIQTALRTKHTMDRKLGELRRAKDHFAKFVPEAVKRLVEANPEAPAWSKRECEVSVLFLGIMGYTRLSEQLSSHDLHAFVEQYFASFLDCIHEAGGDLNETIGDGLMAVFQDIPPLFQNSMPRSHTNQAADAAIALLATTDALNAAHPQHALNIQIGLNSGPALVGTTRFEGLRGTRWTFTASGPVSRLATHLSSLAQAGQILMGPGTAQRLDSAYHVEKLREHQFKDHAEMTAIYQLLGRR